MDTPPSQRPLPASSREKALVRMFEMVTAAHWTSGAVEADGEVHDLRPLLLLMDIGSCASAEKHTRVNCVTASMGDVVIEHFPCVGELLELKASPVSVGRTSLEIAVLVVAHGCRSDDDDAKEEGLTQTKRVCEAFFTYVTTRGPDGEKRFAPPLEQAESGYASDTKWQQILAHFRKELIRSEQALAKRHKAWRMEQDQKEQQEKSIRAKTIFESSEIVLPSNQNHMRNLFGGVVMGWMCKSVMAACVKATRLPLTKFRIRSIQRVDFPTGASVSDHVFFRPRITAIFEEGRSAEFEVMVGKRNVTPVVSEDSLEPDPHDETLMNVGYFYVFGASSYHPVFDKDFSFREFTSKTTRSSLNDNNIDNHPPKLSTDVAPFAGLYRSRSDLYSPQGSSNVVERDMAYQRRKFMLTRRHLLAGIGESIEWDKSMADQAPLLTILAVLRLCDEYERSANPTHSNTISLVGDEEEDDQDGPKWVAVQTDQTNTEIEWAKGDASGLYKTLMLRGKTIIQRKKLLVPESSNGFLEDVFVTLRDKRPQWDPVCVHTEVLETESIDEADEEKVGWDISEYRFKDDTKACFLRAGAYIGDDGSISGQNTSCGVFAARTVTHPKSDATLRIQPSGWLLKKIEDQGDDWEKLEMIVTAEHDLDKIRHSTLFKRMNFNETTTDEAIANALGYFVAEYFENLASFDH